MIKTKQIYASLSKNSAFTYLETLVSLSVISLIAFILPTIFGAFSQFGLIDADLDGDIFIMDIIETSSSADEVRKNGRNTVTFQTERGKIEYQLNNTRVIKSINDQGFIPMMFDVTEWIITESENFIEITIKTNGEFNEEIIIKK